MFKQKYSLLNNQTGYTLIELLVVISIMSLIASIILTNVRSGLIKARDAKRVADFGQMTKALELYYSDFQTYPNCSSYGDCDYTDPSTGSVADSSLNGSFMHFLVPKYLAKDPIDPVNNRTSYLFYLYAGGNAEFPPSSGNFYNYIIGGMLEDTTSQLIKNSITYGNPIYGTYYAVGVHK